MAKRRKLEAPSSADMDRYEEEFRRETPGLARPAPIAQVAAEAAAAFEPGTAQERADLARHEADAAAYRTADAAGLIIQEIPIGQIDLRSIPRDRTTLDPAALAELEQSFSTNGQRLPIEVYQLAQTAGGKPYGLLSGYRRLLAQQNLFARTGAPEFATIKAVLRDPDQMGGAFVAMVEENEIRQDLSHYERGRIAVIAAQQGAFATTEDAVAQMFAAASKAKRSKIRSFALIFEALGDVLNFPETLREKDGLRIAQALRSGMDGALRDALGTGQGVDPASELVLINGVLSGQTKAAKDPKRGGRPKQRKTTPGTTVITTGTGIILRHETDAKGHALRIEGRGVTDETIERVLLELRDRVERI